MKVPKYNCKTFTSSDGLLRDHWPAWAGYEGWTGSSKWILQSSPSSTLLSIIVFSSSWRRNELINSVTPSLGVLRVFEIWSSRKYLSQVFSENSWDASQEGSQSDRSERLWRRRLKQKTWDGSDIILIPEFGYIENLTFACWKFM